MKERFTLENNEAASSSEAAFILDIKTKLRVRIIRFRTVLDMTRYTSVGLTAQVRSLPILLEVTQATIPENKVVYWLKRMADWYYYVHLKPESEGTGPLSSPEG